MSDIQQLQNELQLFSSLLLEFDEMPDKVRQKRLLDWAQALQGLASGPVNDASTSAYLFTTAHAAQLQNSCAATKPVQ